MRSLNSRCVLGLFAAASCVLACAGTATPVALAVDGHSDHDDGHAAPTPPPAAPAKKPASAPAHKAHDDHAPTTTAARPAAADHGDVVTMPASTRGTDSVTPEKHAPTTNAKPSKKVASAPVEIDTPKTPDDALRLLQEGNARWVSGSVSDPNTDTARRSKVANEGQKPFVTILTCADSRLPVERMFDRGVGDAFVVRVAGAVSGPSETGSIEYGVGHLKTPLLVVMGHTKCGAVAAAASGAELHGKVADLVGAVVPAVERVKRNNPGADDKQVAALAVKENVWQSIFDLYKWSPEVRSAVTSGELKVVGAVCDIATGKVEWMGEHPWQNELIDAMNARQNNKNHETASARTDEDERPE